MTYFIFNIIVSFCTAVWLLAVAMQDWNNVFQKLGFMLFLLAIFGLSVHNLAHYLVLKKEDKAYEKGKQDTINKITK